MKHKYRTKDEAIVNFNLTISRMETALKYIEWSHVHLETGEKCCPDCGETEASGHWHGCNIFRAIGDSK